MTARLGLCLLLSLVCCVATPVRAHELDYQSFQLIWDPANATLRGQVVTDPQRVAGQGAARSSQLLTLLRDGVQLEVDGARCPLQLEVRELWVPAGATAGDVVMAYCATAREPRQLRVYAGPELHGLQVTVQRPAADGAVLTDQTLVLAGMWSPTYDFRAKGNGWRDAARANAAGSEGQWALAARYLRYGVAHILDGGWDHVAFVAALIVGAAGAGRLGLGGLIARLSAFTLAHSVTLALGALGVWVLPRAAIEVLIALSIVGMALLPKWQRARRTRPGATLALPFVFGLLHGQGFAGTLVETGLPAVAGIVVFVVALLAFNLGVELGQALWAVAFWWCSRALPAGRAERVLGACAWALAALGVYWACERLLGAFG
jgi:hypothetical protein